MEEDGPGRGGVGTVAATVRLLAGDSRRVKAGEVRYPPADGRQQGHQTVARQNCRAEVPPVPRRASPPVSPPPETRLETSA